MEQKIYVMVNWVKVITIYLLLIAVCCSAINVPIPSLCWKKQKKTILERDRRDANNLMIYPGLRNTLF